MSHSFPLSVYLVRVEDKGWIKHVSSGVEYRMLRRLRLEPGAWTRSKYRAGAGSLLIVSAGIGRCSHIGDDMHSLKYSCVARRCLVDLFLTPHRLLGSCVPTCNTKCE
jgi:hypothetical protein